MNIGKPERELTIQPLELPEALRPHEEPRPEPEPVHVNDNEEQAA